MGDLDGDLVPNLWEYELSDRGKSPDNPYDTYGGKDKTPNKLLLPCTNLPGKLNENETQTKG
ncbi:MAG: hypothetical protein ACPL1K_08000 [Candidatus Kryptoniota bacterium]